MAKLEVRMHLDDRTNNAIRIASVRSLKIGAKKLKTHATSPLRKSILASQLWNATSGNAVRLL